MLTKYMVLVHSLNNGFTIERFFTHSTKMSLTELLNKLYFIKSPRAHLSKMVDEWSLHSYELIIFAHRLSKKLIQIGQKHQQG